ncbi:XRE family transcriptional regulator [Xiashengella succiniciproducens]|jgi:transcriptional regulator with XRE-family HTH domain|uniref:Helix-turn-helix domain-containing protein n=1 Tax=Xiashengella succiniciproducens TaxID=2949635 RepID=A0A9J6ZPW2_9BACT|nr:helix-turn-helix domain-containing protein [Alkaliflexus sp. Ai-910]URW79574.1 helix-turn-helix domain-containing protein [Alkaliflexus sp. Ai-910]
MSLLADNIRYLRNRLDYSQQKVADDLMITRGRYAKYEDGASEPPIDILVRMSRYYNVSIDLLVTVDLRKYSLNEILKLPDNRILLPVKVDRHGANVIELVPHRATMGYLQGYADPEYIESLQTISIPFLGPGKYRAFPAEGDSMPPHPDGSYIIGRYVESIDDLKAGKTYVFITRNEGITYKRLQARVGDELELSPDNALYHSYRVHLADIYEIWEFACSIATREFAKGEVQGDNIAIMRMLGELKEEINNLKEGNKSQGME